MLAHEADALEAQRALYGATIAYTGAGVTDHDLVAIRSDVSAAQFQGFEGAPSSLSFEIEFSALPQRPGKGNLILEPSGARWSVIDVNDRPDIASWVVWVEEAATP